MLLLADVELRAQWLLKDHGRNSAGGNARSGLIVIFADRHETWRRCISMKHEF